MGHFALHARHREIPRREDGQGCGTRGLAEVRQWSVASGRSPVVGPGWLSALGRRLSARTSSRSLLRTTCDERSSGHCPPATASQYFTIAVNDFESKLAPPTSAPSISSSDIR